LEEHRGKPVLIDVFASWCSVCQRTAPQLVEAFHKYGSGRVDFIGVSVDGSPEDAARVKTDWGLPYDVAIDDGRLAKSYKIEVLPTLVLVGADGRVRHVSAGSVSRGELEQWLSER
jgi:thiol-disulfide isomerase/thioredoxin